MRILKNITRMAAFFVLAAVILVEAPTSVYAAMNITVHQTGWDSVPAGNITIDMNQLTIRNATVTMSSNISAITRSEAHLPSSVLTNINDDSIILVLNGDFGTTQQNVSGSVELVWKKVGFYMDGTELDLHMKLTNFVVKAVKDGGKRVTFLAENGTSYRAAHVSMIQGADNKQIVGGVQYDTTYRLYYTGTSTPAPGRFRVGYTDLDICDRIANNGASCPSTAYDDALSTGQFAESITLMDGVVDNKVYLNSNTLTKFIDSSYGANTRAVPTKSTGSTAGQIRSGFSLLADSTAYKVRWAGTSCATSIGIVDLGLDDYGFKYGSWSEYGVYGKVRLGNNRGFASGATYGYNTRNSGVSLNAARSEQNDETSAFSDNINACSISTQTYTNQDCAMATTVIGNQGMGQIAAVNFRDRIVSRFTSGNAQPISETDIWQSRDRYNKCPSSVSNPTGNDKPSCFTAGGVNYVYMSHFNSGNTPANRDANGASHVVVNKTIPVYFGSGSTSTFVTYFLDQNFENSDERNFTYVYQVGTLIIDGDIYIGRYNNGQNSDKDPTVYNANQLRQNIIVADKVLITGRVSHIEAMIIADEVDTCAYASLEDFIAGKRVAMKATNDSTQRQLSNSVCNKELVITSPVIAKKLILHRTYGAGFNENGTYNDKNGVIRSEIFYLRPDLYLWSYSQMQRYSQAVTVNSRELPVRY